MNYFRRRKVVVFNTNLKKATLNKEKHIFFLFFQHCAIISLTVTPFCHGKSHFGKKEAFKPFCGHENSIQIKCRLLV